ncbi:MAG: type I methionyl aminopeptidase [Oscillospiraceae bacterium]|nr:type I methionyl aminopeptidase [Oscillospiraceae bacterium]
MIQLKNTAQIDLMRIAGRITGEALAVAEELVRPGVSTFEIDKAIRAHIEKSGAKPSFLGYGGFPGSACISINDEVIHGIPSKKRILQEGDIVKVDVGAFIKGFHGDAARTFAVGKIAENAARLIEATKESFYRGVAQATVGNRIGDIGAAVEACAKENGYSVVRRYVGHGVGHELHESPEVPNFGTPGRGARIYEGMVIAIEPMVNEGVCDVIEMSDGWTVKTADRKLSAHYENTVAITEEGPILLTEIK